MPDAPPAVTFADLGLAEPLLRTLASLGHDEPTPVQAAALPPLLEGRDVLAQAATGTGKTGAFALPVLQRLADGGRHSDGSPVAVVLAPTRELATQVAVATRSYGERVSARVVTACGGQPIGPQLGGLRDGCDVVVATPGRAVDLLQRGALRLGGVDVVVLDEADEMLDLGFAEELDAVLDATPAERQTVLVSATLPRRTEGLARRHLRDPVALSLGTPAVAPGDSPQVRHVGHLVPAHAKAAALARVLDVEDPGAALVFCRTRQDVERLTETLQGRGLRAEALHGGLAQESRDRVMARLRSGNAQLLVATDVAARGLDVDVLTHVVNVDVPRSPETFTHRVGRVGRAGREGVAITLVAPSDRRLLANVERVTRLRVPLEPVPDLAAARAVRAARTRADVRAVLAGGTPDGPDVPGLRRALDALVADGATVEEVALGALLVAHAAAGRSSDGEQEVPRALERPARDDTSRSSGRDGGRPDRVPDRASGGRGGDAPDARTTRLFVSAGRRAGVRPQDLVGAITGESALTGRDVGAIDVTDGFSLVDVPSDAADAVIAALGRAKVRGRTVTVRRDRDGRPRADRSRAERPRRPVKVAGRG